MYLQLSTWTPHLNQLLYSYHYYCKKHDINIVIEFNPEISHNGCVLTHKSKTIFFDYSDDSAFLSSPDYFDFYFKRSLKVKDRLGNVYPLNFNVALTYKPLRFLFHQKLNFLSFKHNRTEVIRALDIFSAFINSAHAVMDIRRFPISPVDNGGKVIFCTRLWNPKNHVDPNEKLRREIQNEFRIKACRIIRENFGQARVGLFPDEYSEKLAPDILLPRNIHRKKKYMNELAKYDIGIADDGLKDNPGWKIGEYAMFGKAIVTTPINIQLDNFEASFNYMETSNRSAYEELPDLIAQLIKDKTYLKFGMRNKKWSDFYLHPENYLDRIIELVNNKTSNISQ